MTTAPGVRWSVGDATPETIDALEASMRSVHRVFRGAAPLAVCVHSMPMADVRERLQRSLAERASWLQVDHDVPVFVRRRVDVNMAEASAWRFAPLRVFTGRSELTLALDAVFDVVPDELRAWLAAPAPRRCLISADRQKPRATPVARRRRILVRGLPPTFDLESALEATLASGPDLLDTADQIVQAEIAALSAGAAPLVLDAGRFLSRQARAMGAAVACAPAANE